MAPDSINDSPSSVTSVGTRPSGLYSRMRSKSLPMDQLACSKGSPMSFMEIATRRTKGESNIPISSIRQTSLVRLQVEEIVDDRRGDQRVDQQEPEEGPAARGAPLDLELHAQHRILADVPLDPLLCLGVADVLAVAQHLHGLVEPALGQQGRGFGRQRLEARLDSHA